MIEKARAASPTRSKQWEDICRAFDRVAKEYDGPLGNNAIVQQFRQRLWQTVELRVPRGSRLLDLGGGTGLDAVHFARLGYHVQVIDQSSHMIEQVRRRALQEGVADRVKSQVLGFQDLAALTGTTFDALYSNLGALNCYEPLAELGAICADLLVSGGWLVVSVIGRYCPWEVLAYLLAAQPRKAAWRLTRRVVPVSLRDETIWTRYWTPGAFARELAPRFDVVNYRGLGVFAPPPYLIGLSERLPFLGRHLFALDDLVGELPVLRSCGDHFLMVLKRRD